MIRNATTDSTFGHRLEWSGNESESLACVVLSNVSMRTNAKLLSVSIKRKQSWLPCHTENNRTQKYLAHSLWIKEMYRLHVTHVSVVFGFLQHLLYHFCNECINTKIFFYLVFCRSYVHKLKSPRLCTIFSTCFLLICQQQYSTQHEIKWYILLFHKHKQIQWIFVELIP